MFKGGGVFRKSRVCARLGSKSHTGGNPVATGKDGFTRVQDRTSTSTMGAALF